MAIPTIPTLSTLPLVLVGPILRRVTKTKVAVWVATRAPATVTMKIYRTAAGPEIPLASTPTVTTTQIGQNLHVALVEAETTAAGLDNASVYYYDLTFSNTGTVEGGFNAAGVISAPGVPSSPTTLGYTSASSLTTGLPSFVAPATDLTNLRISQGSCRKAHANSIDMMAVLDADIGRNLANVTNTSDKPGRPQQLYLTGDQIYADDVSDSQMALIQQVATALMGTPTGHAEPFLTLPSTAPELKTGFRAPYVHDVVKFTTDPETPLSNAPVAKNHLLRFSEFCAMYALMWSPVLWPTVGGSPVTPALPSFPDVYSPASQFPQTYNAGHTTFDTPLFAEFKRENEALTSFVRTLPAARRALANVATYMLLDDHEVADDFYINRLWVTGIIGSAEGKAAIRNALLAYGIFQAWGNVPSLQVGGGASPLADLVTKAKAWWADEFGASSPSLPAINTLLRIPQSLDPANNASFGSAGGGLDWNFAIAFDSYEVIALDTRTHRLYPGPNKAGITPAALIEDASLLQQLPDVPSSGPFASANIALTILVTPGPWAGLSLVENAQLGAKTAEKAFDKDVESLHFDKPAYDSVVTRCGARRNNSRVVVFCGDIHHAFATHVQYWSRKDNPLSGTAQPRDTRVAFAQVISSAIKNQDISRKFFSTLAAHFAGFKVNPRDITRLGWKGQAATGQLKVGTAVLPVADPATRQLANHVVEWDVSLGRNSTAVTELEDEESWYVSATPTVPIDWRVRRVLFAGDPLGAQVNPVSAGLEALVAFIQLFFEWLFGYVAVARGGKEVVGVNNIGFLTLSWGAGEEKSAVHDVNWFKKSYDKLYADQASGSLDFVNSIAHTRVTIPLSLDASPPDATIVF